MAMRPRSPLSILFAAVAGGCVLLSWRMQTTPARSIDTARALLVWLAGIACVLLAVWRPSPRGGAKRVRSWSARHRPDLAIVASLFVVAAASQFVRLGTHPWVMHSDEGFFALGAVDALHGVTTNPFATGFLGHPVLYFFAEAFSMRFFGETVFAARSVSALQATMAVPLCYVTAKRLFGSRLVAVWAALLLGTHAIFLFWGRHTLNNISAILFMLAVILLLDLVRDGGARWPVVLGLTLGVAQYTYFSVRVLPFVAATYLALLAVQEWRGGDTLARAARQFAARVALTAGGFAVAVAPLAGFYRTHPDVFGGRVDSTSIFATGWLDRRMEETGQPAALVLWHQFVDAAAFPFFLFPNGQFRGDIPFVGVPLAVIGGVGLLVASLRFWERRYLGIAIAYWGTTAAMALTISPYMTHRWMMALPPLCLAGAAGLQALLLGPHRVIEGRPAVGAAAGSAAVLVAAAWSLHLYFHDPIQRGLFTDPGAEVGDYLAAEIASVDPEATVYFGGPPYQYYRGQGHLVFKTPRVTSVDLLEPLTPATPKPALIGTTVFVFLPARVEEAGVVRAWYPSGRYHETWRADVLLYASYVVERPPEP